MTPNRPNILLISLDTVRADHLSCYGYSEATTPNIDELAQDGIIFESAYSTAAWTPPAHASMLTGLYPSEHGVVDHNRLDPNIPTIAEVLLANGYNTSGFVNNSQVGQLVGLDKGHETFVEVWRGIGSRNIILRATRWLGRKTLDFIHLKDHGARITNRLAMKWLEIVRKDEKPFYLFLHYIDAHNPLKAPLPYTTKFADKTGTDRIDRKKIKLMADNPLRFYTQSLQLNDTENSFLVSLYDGEIAYLDRIIGGLLRYLKKKDLYHNTLIIVTSDHGEHFGEHDHYSHVSSLYQPIIHVPLILKTPNSFLKGRKIEQGVQLIDIYSTVADIASIEPNISDSIFGKSLLSDNHSLYHDFIVSEWEGRVPYFILRELKCSRVDERVRKFTLPSLAIIKANYKLIIRSNGSQELYDLKNDPEENNNIMSDNHPVANTLKECYKAWKEQVQKKNHCKNTQNVDEETRANLQALGYM